METYSREQDSASGTPVCRQLVSSFLIRDMCLPSQVRLEYTTATLLTVPYQNDQSRDAPPSSTALANMSSGVFGAEMVLILSYMRSRRVISATPNAGFITG